MWCDSLSHYRRCGKSLVTLTYDAALLQNRCCLGVYPRLISLLVDMLLCVCLAGAGLLQPVRAVWAGGGHQWELAQSAGAPSLWTRTSQSTAGPVQGEWKKVVSTQNDFKMTPIICNWLTLINITHKFIFCLFSFFIFSSYHIFIWLVCLHWQWQSSNRLLGSSNNAT